MRRIVVVGNCQAQAMRGLYGRFVVPRTRDVVDYVASYESLTPADRRLIEQADLIVEQVFGVALAVDLADLNPAAPRILLPNVSASFLWPHAGQPHPRNPAPAFMPMGPFDAEASDSFLNRLILQGVDADEALAAYLGLDIARKAHLDRLLELVVDRQRARDTATGYEVADTILAHFRDEQIFLTPHHPNLRIARIVASELLQRLGARRDEIERMQGWMRVTPFPRVELPVHPGVARHFGLSWAGDERRYQFMNEGRFTFAEYARRYVDCTWNEALAEGLALVHQGDVRHAEERLRTGLRESPTSSAGWLGLSHVLARGGRLQDAIAAATQATIVEPGDPDTHQRRGALLELAQDFAGAKDAFDRAIMLHPVEPQHHLRRGQVLVRLGDPAEAVSAFEAAIAADPYAVSPHVELARLRSAEAAWPEAERLLRRAVALAPEEPAHRRDLWTVLARMGRLGDAISAIEERIAADPRDAEAHAALAELLVLDQRPEAAIEALRRAVAIDGGDADRQVQLARLLIACGRHAEAAAAARAAQAAKPDDFEAAFQLGDLLISAGATREGAAILEAIGRERVGDIGLILRIGDALARSRQFDPAIALARAAVGAQPENPVTHRQLGHLLLLAGRPADAEVPLLWASVLEPGSSHAHYQLSEMLDRLGRLREAVAAADRAAALAPEVVQVWLHLGHLREKAGDRVGAEAALRHATRIAPADGRTRMALSRLLLRLQDRTGSVAEADAAAQLLPTSAEAQCQLSMALLANGRLEEAEAAARRAVSYEEANGHAWHQLSIVLMQQERFPDAIGPAARAADLEPGNPHRQALLARLREQVGAPLEA